MEEETSSKSLQQKLLKRIEDFSRQLEVLQLPEYVEYLRNPKKMLWINFLVGVARGVGVGVGATVIAALIIYTLSKLVTLPLIGRFFADIIKIVQVYLHQ